jgi:hypothetical protein
LSNCICSPSIFRWIHARAATDWSISATVVVSALAPRQACQAW